MERFKSIVPDTYVPLHVGTNRTVKIDEQLLRALIEARAKGGSWVKYEEAIKAFNRGNTDSNEITEETEAVLVCSAFERLFDLRHGREDELSEAFLQAVPANIALEIKDCDRIKTGDKNWIQRAKSVSDLWIREFFRARSKLAHGRSLSELPLIWSLKEHLLFAAFIFPLVVKAELSKEGFYKITEDDNIAIYSFEHLLCHLDLFKPIKNDSGLEEWPWNSIRSISFFTRIEHEELNE